MTVIYYARSSTKFSGELEEITNIINYLKSLMMRQFGIWEFDINFGLIGRPENSPEQYITKEKLWEVEEMEHTHVWRWPILLARYRWFTPQVAQDFNKAFFYAQEFFEGQRPESLLEIEDFDIRTVQCQTTVLKDLFSDSGEEILLEV